MKRKNKVIILILVIFLLIVTSGIGIYIGIRNNSNMMLQELYINKWNNTSAKHLICRANVIGEPWIVYEDCFLAFNTNSDISDIISTNKEEHIGEIRYQDGSIVRKANLFYADSNYYVLYYDEQNDYYAIENCFLMYHMDDIDCNMPSPVPIGISYDRFALSQDFHTNELDYLYDNYTFEEAVEFYGRISEEYVSIDKEKQQITLDGYEVYRDIIVEECLTLDFKNRTVIVTKSDGSKKELDGTERMEQFD